MTLQECVQAAVNLDDQVQSLGDSYLVVAFGDTASKSVFLGVSGSYSEFIISAYGLSVTVAIR